ncbi:arsenate reductase family protein [Marinigracilibium pacificum]|uniref:Arsenate reductase n=1 Tax=Marinigracilibium pacificum TaxID=2729599 RepID=A0A848IWD2_9BACT|nr:hypothetical protein [Marinigracilibium pacificum]NMM47986.1 hypothetical protein [Marinigracilibium pacificum]
MELRQKEIKLLIHHYKELDKKALGYAELSPNAVQIVNLDQESLTPRMIKEIIDLLGVDVSKIIDRNSDTFIDKFKNVELSEEDWLRVLSEKNDLIKTPIVLSEDKNMIVDAPSRLLEFRDEYLKPVEK